MKIIAVFDKTDPRDVRDSISDRVIFKPAKLAADNLLVSGSLKVPIVKVSETYPGRRIIHAHHCIVKMAVSPIFPVTSLLPYF